MSVTFAERPNSYRTTTGPQSVTFGYVVTGVFDLGSVRTLAIASVPMLMYSMSAGPLYRSNINAEEAGYGVWHVDVTWGPHEKKEPEQYDCKWSMNTTGGTEHMTMAKDTIAMIVPTDSSGKYQSTPVSDYNAIGVDLETGEVQGVDVIAPVQEWTENYQLLIANYSWNYMDTVVTPMTRLVNNATFRNKPKGSVLFKGGTGGRSSKDPLFLDLSLTFAFQAPITSPLTIPLPNGASLTIPSKEGWHYLDFMYGTQKAQSGQSGMAWRANKVLKQVDVKRLYDYGDFSLFGVGTGSLGVQ